MGDDVLAETLDRELRLVYLSDEWGRKRPTSVPLSRRSTIEDFRALVVWHDERCAMCGRRDAPSAMWPGEVSRFGTTLYVDHDRGDRRYGNRNGLVRGLLCHACNADEGRSAAPEWRTYREYPPAKLVGFWMGKRDLVDLCPLPPRSPCGAPTPHGPCAYQPVEGTGRCGNHYDLRRKWNDR